MNPNDNRPVSDAPLISLLDSALAGSSLIAAHDLGLFELLDGQPATATELAGKASLAVRPVEIVLSMLGAAGLLRRDEQGRFALTTLAEDYLLRRSPTYYGGMLDLRMATAQAYTAPALKKAILENRPQIYGGDEPFGKHEERADLAERFTRGMHSRSSAAATVWPSVIDLGVHHRMLDIGGGSGAHSIGARKRWPHLEAVVFDLATVLPVTQSYAAQAGVSVGTHAGDFWNDPFPQADLHFYSIIYHDWPPEKNRFLTRKSFEALPSGGRILIHEVLYDEDKMGPWVAAIYSVNMLVWTEGRQYSGGELRAMLDDAGFRHVEVIPAFGSWSLVTGVKP